MIMLFLIMRSWHVHFAIAATPQLIKTAFYTFTLLSFVPAFEYAQKGSSRLLIIISYLFMACTIFSFLKDPTQLYVTIPQSEWWNMLTAVTPLFTIMTLCFVVYWYKHISFDYKLYLPNTMLLVTLEGTIITYSILHTLQWINSFSNTLLLTVCLLLLLMSMLFITKKLEASFKREWITLFIAIICLYALTTNSLPTLDSIALFIIRTSSIGAVVLFIASHVPFLQKTTKQAYANGL